jgi:hypothetical protein
LVEALTFDWMRMNYRLLSLIPLALAVLSYVFLAQRREEIGVLHAIGRSRRWLVLRTVRETASAIGLAWLASALVLGIGLIGVQVGLYAPRA